jgi:hypothetical protein
LKRTAHFLWKEVFDLFGIKHFYGMFEVLHVPSQSFLQILAWKTFEESVCPDESEKF